MQGLVSVLNEFSQSSRDQTFVGDGYVVFLRNGQITIWIDDRIYYLSKSSLQQCYTRVQQPISA